MFATAIPDRRRFLRSAGCGFGSLALASLLAEEGLLASEVDPLAPKKPHHEPTAKRVIFLFMSGGPSHVDTFDPKPELTRLHGQKLPASFGTGEDAARRGQEQAARVEADLQEVRPGGHRGLGLVPAHGKRHRRHLRAARLLRRQRHAPGVGVPDEHRLDPDGPAEPGGVGELRPGHREPQHAGVRRHARPRRLAEGGLARVGQRLPARGVPGHGASAAASRRSSICPTRPGCRTSSSGGRSTSSPRAIASIWPRRGEDSELAARIAAYELAFRMQAHAPELVDLAKETEETKRLYGLDRKETERVRHCAVCSRGGWSSAASASCRSTRATPTAGTGTPTWRATTASSRWPRTGRSRGCSPISSAAGLLEGHARHLGRRVRPHADDRGRRTAATTTRTASRCGWRAAA